MERNVPPPFFCWVRTNPLVAKPVISIPRRWDYKQLTALNSLHTYDTRIVTRNKPCRWPYGSTLPQFQTMNTAYRYHANFGRVKAALIGRSCYSLPLVRLAPCLLAFRY